MTDANEENLTEFIDFLSKPENLAASLFWKNDAATSDSTQQALRKTCQLLFQRVESLSKTYSKITEKTDQGESLTGLPELYTGSSDQGPVDSETLWGQVDLQNEALQSLLKKSIRNLDKATKTKGEEIRLLEDAGDDTDDEAMEEESEENDADSAEGEDDDDDDQDSETKRIEARMERAMADMEEEDDSEDDDDELERSDRKQDKVATEEESVDDPAADELNDGFFDIQEMEEFADEEEEYLPDAAFGQPVPEKEDASDKRSFHQKQRDGEVDSGSDEDEEEEALFRAETTVRRKKYREDDEIDALYSLYEEPKSDDEDEDEDDDDEDDDEDNDIINMTAADIFGKPKPKYFDKWNAKTHEKGKAKEKKDDDSWNDYDFDNDKEETTGWNDGEDADGFDENKNEESGSDEEDDERGDNGATKKSIGGTKKSVKKSDDAEAPAGGDPKADKLRRQVEELEKEMLAEKPWQMVGESTSTSRPVNSLLEMTPTFEAASKTAPMITVEHTADLEEIIKQRIISEDFDDVVPRELPDVGWHKKRGELPEVSQEKSKLGLGELYEREYLKKAVGYDVDAAEKESAEEQAKNEMKSLFANLCSKLDALSNYHFAPRPIADEAEVKAITTPAIAMEEVLPLHVSNSRATAPEEIYGAKRGRDAVLQGESERDQQERKRLRGSKKATRRKVRKDKLADEKLISRLQPGMGLDNPYEKRKMREELSVARAHGKVTTGEEDTNTKYGASGTFFKRMQEEAEKTIRGGQDGDEEKKKRPKSKSSALKL
jgi:U3 small nucleolar RNA-associated protein MPP10